MEAIAVHLHASILSQLRHHTVASPNLPWQPPLCADVGLKID